MILRIQSFFLFCTMIVTGLLFFMPVASIIVPGNFTFDFYTTKVVQAGNPPVFMAWNWISLILNALITFLAFLTIFIHRKKSKTVKPTLLLQFRLCAMNIILMLGLLILMWIQIRQRTGEIQGEWFTHIGFIFPILGIILTWLAIRGLVKDIALLKSFDRIR